MANYSRYKAIVLENKDGVGVATLEIALNI